MATHLTSISFDFQVDLFAALLVERVKTETLKLISCRDDHLRGFVTVENSSALTSALCSTLKRALSKESQPAKPRISPKQSKPKSLGTSNARENSFNGDYAVLSAASSKVDTSNLISVVQNLRTNEREYRCSFCEYVSKSQPNAKRHVELKHLNAGEVLQCKSCGQKIKLKASLKRHYMKTHNMPPEAAAAMLN